MTIPSLNMLENVPHQTGYLVINEDGAVNSSGGDMENDERRASIIMNIVKMAEKHNLVMTADKNEKFKRLSFNFDDHLYAVTIFNKKIHVVKRKYIPADPVMA